jgi:hypothetical protein
MLNMYTKPPLPSLLHKQTKVVSLVVGELLVTCQTGFTICLQIALLEVIYIGLTTLSPLLSPPTARIDVERDLNPYFELIQGQKEMLQRAMSRQGQWPNDRKSRY